ncbi:tetratricopeptide repeat protein [Aurantibacillus circumpalustris]|uniref:tetratricopeptide repeat protein n=1 Tax=Aurantibacillus circumpalustris TaxID=3036359 RepID=UPI00295B72EA|nr:tetratricopeptide repeat protein [Aurantibacillus circumpalustris]
MRLLILHIFIFFALIIRAQTPFENFRERLQEEDFKTAQSIIDSCSYSNYHMDSVLYYKGLLTLKKGNIRGARTICNNLKKMYPDFFEQHYLSALIYFVNQNYGNCINEFTIVLQKDSMHLKALYNRSLAYGMLDDYTRAIEGLSKCVLYYPNYAMGYYSRAYWYEYSVNYTEAKKDYEKSIALNPKNYDAYMGLAYIYQNEKNSDKACDIINNAITAGSQIAEELKENFCR